MAALWASTGLSITLPILPEKSIATREFSDTLRYGEGEYRVIKVDTCQQLPHGTDHADKKDGWHANLVRYKKYNRNDQWNVWNMGNVCQLHWCLPPGGSLEALLLELNGEDLVIRNLTKSNLPQVLKSVIVVFFFVVESCNSGTIQSRTGTHKQTVWLNNTVHRLN